MKGLAFSFLVNYNSVSSMFNAVLASNGKSILFVHAFNPAENFVFPAYFVSEDVRHLLLMCGDVRNSIVSITYTFEGLQYNFSFDTDRKKVTLVVGAKSITIDWDHYSLLKYFYE